MSSKRLVPCPCPCCRGKKVSSYTRKRHSDLYIHGCAQTAEQGTNLSGQTDAPVDVLSSSNDSPLQEVTDVKEDNQQNEIAMEDEQDYCLSPLGGGYQSPNHDLYSPASISFDSPPENSQAYDTACIDQEERMLMYTSDLAVTPLYKNAPTTVLEALKHQLSWFSNHPSISKEALSDMLHTLHHQILPHENALPDSYDEAMKLIKDFLITPIVYHCCPNDCVVFRGDFAESVVCPTCGAERYSRNKIPSKSFTYFPIGPRIVRMFESPVYSKLIQAHASSLQDEPELVYDIQQSKVWKEAYGSDGMFKGDGRGIALALCADGVNPFHINRVQYSMCPLVMSLLNLPRHLRYQFSNLLLVGIIPGPKEPQSMNIYLDILVDELMELNTRHIYDAHLGEEFDLSVRILSYVLDYPGIGKLFHTLGSGAYQGCLWCEIQGVRNDQLHKVIYLENRRFLPDASELRQDSVSFPSKTIEVRPPPQLRSYDTVSSIHKAYDKAKNKSQAAALAKATGCKGSYPLMDLPTHNRLSQTAPDMMHTLKDTVEKLFEVITGRDSNSSKVQKAESEIGRFQDCIQLQTSKRRRINTKESSSHATSVSLPVYRISSEQINLANRRAMSVLSPSEFSPGCFFSKSTSLKSHDWKELACCGILKYCLRGMLGDKQRQTLFYFLDTLSLACSEGVSVALVDSVEERFHKSLALIERDFPVSVQDITTHILHHVADSLRRYGPVYSTWMYPYERFNSWMCRRAMNRRRPEATIIETYRIFEWCHFASVSGLLSSSLPDGPSSSMSSGVERELTDAELHQLDSLYAQLIPRYKYLCNEYDKALAQAAIRRTKASFPPRETWQPPFPISPNDRELLHGPKKDVLVHKKYYKEMANTKRLILFTSSEGETASSRTVCSYVQITSDSVRLGRILKIFDHEFAGTVYHLAIVQEYQDKFTDPDSKLWWVKVERFSTAIFQLSSLSRPRFTAREDGRLWFLNVS